MPLCQRLPLIPNPDPSSDAADDTALYTALYIARRISAFSPTEERPFVLGLPTGGTPLATYRHLVRLYREEKVSFRYVHTVRWPAGTTWSRWSKRLLTNGSDGSLFFVCLSSPGQHGRVRRYSKVTSAELPLVHVGES
jgi:hypothetical protein